jgi:transcription factor IIIB subunit 2
VEGAGGASSMVGQFVSATSSKAYTGGGGAGGRGGRYGFSRASRESTLANGRRRIQDVASRLRLGSHYVDAAHRLFTIAVEKNFVQGRRTTHVVAACLYIACRQEKSQHMLIDFSDALQVNVYVLGTCFLKFRRLLGLKLEIIDPALFVYRFAAHLDLDEKANAVALTALRLVGRMKRDWIVSGRRPAGICAAALLIAARAHGFSRHQQDVTKILRVCGMTVTSRVKEFEHTPSAMLTLDQFNTVELDSEADPPVYTRNKFLEARAKAIQENNVELLTSGQLDDPREGKKATKWRRQKLNPKKAKFKQLYQNIEKELVATSSSNKDADSEDGETEPVSEKDGETSTQIVLRPEGELSFPSEDLAHMYPKSKYGRALLLPGQATVEELQKSTQPTEEKIDFTAWKEEMPKSDIDEIDSLFRSEEEIAQKEAIFNKMNKDYLAQQERKESQRLRAEAASKDQEKDDAAQAEGHARYTNKTGRGRKRRRDSVEGESEEPTTEEALYAAVSSRKISRKINYDAMSAIFDEDGTFDTNILDGEGEDPSEEMEEVDPVLTMV